MKLQDIMKNVSDKGLCVVLEIWSSEGRVEGVEFFETKELARVYKAGYDTASDWSSTRNFAIVLPGDEQYIGTTVSEDLAVDKIQAALEKCYGS